LSATEHTRKAVTTTPRKTKRQGSKQARCKATSKTATTTSQK
jgi:hypothetical protein